MSKQSEFHAGYMSLRAAVLVLSVVLVQLVAVSCNSPSQEDYIPASTQARRAVEMALTAWRNGDAMERIAQPGSVAVQPQDSDWKAGKRLTDFTITKELPATDGPRQFEVQLKLRGTQQPVDAVYVVVGRDPLWVFRDKDYQRATGM